MSGIGPAFDQDGSGAAPAREAARPAPRVVADPAADGAAPPAHARTDAAIAAPVATSPVPTRAATAATAVDTPTPVDAASAQAARTAAAPATAALPPKPVATVQAPTARPAASPADAGSLGGLVFSLLLIVGLILALGWLARRMPGFGGGAATRNGLRVVASLPVGARERVVVVDVGGTQLLLGVGAAGVRTLHTLDAPLPETAAGAPSPFAQVLAQHFGKKA